MTEKKGIEYTILIDDNNHIKMLHVKWDKLKTKQQVQKYLDLKYKKPRIKPMNLYGVHIPEYELEKPELIAVLKGHAKEKILIDEETKLTHKEWQSLKI